MNAPPRFAEKIVDWLCEFGEHEDIPGDLLLQFERNKLKRGNLVANWIYFWSAISLARPFIIKEKFKYNPRIAYSIGAIAFYRNINRSKVNFFLVSLSLSLGLIFASFILHYSNYELNYDKQYSDIYRISSAKNATTSLTFSETIEKEFKEITSIGRISKVGVRNLSYTTEQHVFKKGFYANEKFLELFNLKFIAGIRELALDKTNSIVLTEKSANKLFGEVNPLNKSITLNGNKTYTVTGVISNLPSNSHLNIDFLISFSTIYLEKSEYQLNNPHSWIIYSYVKLDPKEVANLNIGLKELTFSYWKELYPTLTHKTIDDDDDDYEAQLISEIHLGAKKEAELGKTGNLKSFYILVSIGILILLISCTNFVNYTMAQFLRRASELHIRKAIGANRSQLFTQFSIESLLALVVISILAIIVSNIFFPTYVQITGLQQFNEYSGSFEIAVIILIITMVIFILVNVIPFLIIKRITSAGSVGNLKLPRIQITNYRQILLTFQFVIALLVLSLTLVINQQMSLIDKTDLGYNSSELIYAKLFGDYKEDLANNYDSLQLELKGNPNVQAVSRVSNIMGNRFGLMSIRKSKTASINSEVKVRILSADKNFLSTLNVNLIEGRNFSDTSIYEIIVNEAAQDLFSKSDLDSIYVPLHGNMTKVGVIENFNFSSLHNKIEPLLIINRPDLANQIIIKVNSNDYYNNISFLENTIVKFLKNSTPEISILKSKIDEQYDFERGLTNIVYWLSIVSLIMLFTGLQSILNYVLETRFKEVAIRKVMGANPSQLIKLLSKEFIRILIVAIAIAVPLGVFLSNYWLSFFEYKINSPWLHIIVSGALFSLTITLFLAYVINSSISKNTIRQLDYN